MGGLYCPRNPLAWAVLFQLASMGRNAAFDQTSGKMDNKCVDRKGTLLLAKGKDEGQMDFL